MSKVTPIGRRRSPQAGDGADSVPGPEAPAAASRDDAKNRKSKKRRPERPDPDWLENKVRALYAEVVEEPLPLDLQKLVKEIERKKH